MRVAHRLARWVVLSLSFAGCESSGPDGVAVPKVEVTPAPVAGMMPAAVLNHNFLESDAISAGLVGRLKPAWEMKTTEPVSGEPAVDGDALYAADWGGNVYAVERATGKVRWQKKVHEPNRAWPWYGFAGTPVVVGETIYIAATEGDAYAIDKRTGDVRWKSRFTKQPNAGSIGRILVYDGVMYVGVSSVEEQLDNTEPGFVLKFTGEVVAIDAKTGGERWRLPLADPPHTGVSVWSGFAIDPGPGTLYFTTGNNYSDGATKLSDSIVAVDTRDGRIRWSYQATPGDVWTMKNQAGPDYDFGASPQLFEAVIDGRNRRLLGAGQKSGTFFALDRETGEVVWQVRVGSGARAGGIMADAAIHENQINLFVNDAYALEKPAEHPMDIVAIDATSGQPLWVTRRAQAAGVSGAGVVLGNVYFVPSLDGHVRGFRTYDGRQVWASGHHASVGSSVAADARGIYFGTGVPEIIGGIPTPSGLIAYRLAE